MSILMKAFGAAAAVLTVGAAQGTTILYTSPDYNFFGNEDQIQTFSTGYISGQSVLLNSAIGVGDTLEFNAAITSSVSTTAQISYYDNSYGRFSDVTGIATSVSTHLGILSSTAYVFDANHAVPAGSEIYVSIEPTVNSTVNYLIGAADANTTNSFFSFSPNYNGGNLVLVGGNLTLVGELTDTPPFVLYQRARHGPGARAHQRRPFADRHGDALRSTSPCCYTKAGCLTSTHLTPSARSIAWAIAPRSSTEAVAEK